MTVACVGLPVKVRFLSLGCHFGQLEDSVLSLSPCPPAIVASCSVGRAVAAAPDGEDESQGAGKMSQ